MSARTAEAWERLYNAALGTLPPERRLEAESGTSSCDPQVTWVQTLRRNLMQAKYNERRDAPQATDAVETKAA